MCEITTENYVYISKKNSQTFRCPQQLFYGHIFVDSHALSSDLYKLQCIYKKM